MTRVFGITIDFCQTLLSYFHDINNTQQSWDDVTILLRDARSPATASIATRTASPNGRRNPPPKILAATVTIATTDEMRHDTRSVTRQTPRRRPETATHAHAQARGGRILPDQSQTPTFLQRSHRGAATHSVTAALATATITIRMMSTHAEMIASATTAAM